MDFLAISGCYTSLYRSQGGAMELLLCDPDKSSISNINLSMLIKRWTPTLLSKLSENYEHLEKWIKLMLILDL